MRAELRPSQPAPGAQPIQGRDKIGFDGCEWSLSELPAGNGHDIHTPGMPRGRTIRLKAPEDVAESAFGGVANHCAPNLTGSHDPQPIDRTLVRQGEKGQIAGRLATPLLLDDGEVRA